MGSVVGFRGRGRGRRRRRAHLADDGGSEAAVEPAPAVVEQDLLRRCERRLALCAVAHRLCACLDHLRRHAYQACCLCVSKEIEQRKALRKGKGGRRTTSPTHAASMWFSGARFASNGECFFIVSYVEKNTAAVNK